LRLKDMGTDEMQLEMDGEEQLGMDVKRVWRLDTAKRGKVGG
jgi:hypothetical protein